MDQISQTPKEDDITTQCPDPLQFSLASQIVEEVNPSGETASTQEQPVISNTVTQFQPPASSYIGSAPNSSAEPSSPVIPQTNSTQPSSESFPAPVPAQPKKKKKVLLITLIAAFLALVGAVAALFLFVLNPSVKSVVILEKPEPLYRGESVQLTAEISPSKASKNAFITWYSSDPAIAAVSNSGLVTATGNGTCTVTAKADDKETSVQIRALGYNEKEEIVLGKWHAIASGSINNLSTISGYLPLRLNEDLTGSMDVGDSHYTFTWSFSSENDRETLVFQVVFSTGETTTMVYTSSLNDETIIIAIGDLFVCFEKD